MSKRKRTKKGKSLDKVTASWFGNPLVNNYRKLYKGPKCMCLLVDIFWLHFCPILQIREQKEWKNYTLIVYFFFFLQYDSPFVICARCIQTTYAVYGRVLL